MKSPRAEGKPHQEQHQPPPYLLRRHQPRRAGILHKVLRQRAPQNAPRATTAARAAHHTTRSQNATQRPQKRSDRTPRSDTTSSRNNCRSRTKCSGRRRGPNTTPSQYGRKSREPIPPLILLRQGRRNPTELYHRPSQTPNPHSPKS